MNRNNILKFRATDEEAAEIRRKAEAAGMSVSKFLRTSAIEGNVVLYDTSDLYGLRTDIKRIGNNINQIAMVVNSNRDLLFHSHLLSLISMIIGKIILKNYRSGRFLDRSE